MMLRNYQGKQIALTTIKGKSYRGKGLEFIFAEDNNPPKNSLIIRAVGYEYPIEIYEDEVESIEIVK